MKPIRIASTSDVHLGHHNTPTGDIIERLEATVFNEKTIASVDILVIVGDLFDRLLDAGSEEISLIRQMVGRLLVKCQRHDIWLLVLEGTPDHDRKQSRVFIDINQALSQMNSYNYQKLRYVDKLDIVQLEDLGVSWLFVPDEWRPSTETTLAEVRSLLSERGLEKVDFAAMHGMFPFQMDIPGLKSLHDQDAYLDLVRYLIFIGHVHQYSFHVRIVSQGSFDRYVHGDESAKGWVLATVFPDGKFKLEFKENVGAKTYLTIDLDKLDLNDALLKVMSIADTLRDGSSVRIRADKESAVFSNSFVFREKWPNIDWSFDRRSKETVANASVYLGKAGHYEPIILNENTLRGCVEKKLNDQGYASADVLRLLRRLDLTVGSLKK